MVNRLFHITFVCSNIYFPTELWLIEIASHNKKKKYFYYSFLILPWMYRAIYILFINSGYREIIYKVFIGYSHFPCNLRSARLCLFYCHMNGLLYYACKNQKDINNIKINYLLWKSICFTPIEGAVVQKVGWTTEMAGNIWKDYFDSNEKTFVELFLFLGFPGRQGEMWSVWLAVVHEKDSLVCFAEKPYSWGNASYICIDSTSPAAFHTATAEVLFQCKQRHQHQQEHLVPVVIANAD